jgi:hypothetical protein
VVRAHADLDRAVSELGTDLTDLRHTTDDGFAGLRRDTTNELEERVRPLSDTVADHDASLRRVLARQERNRNPPVDWSALTAAQAARHWSRLADWIEEVFVPWGEVTRDALPDCWALHRPVLVQLSWLRSAYVQAYLPASEPSVAGDWHIRWSPAVLAKIKDLIQTKWCRPGEHMITVEDSTARRRAAGGPTAPQQQARPGVAGGVAQLGRMQLAEREYWQAFYIQARDADLAWRTARDERNLLNRPNPETDGDGEDSDETDGMPPG